MNSVLRLLGCLLAACASAALARDLSLAETEQLLSKNNRELQAARRAVESAQAQQVIAGARPNATLSVNSTSINDSNAIDGIKRTADTTLRIDQPFERGNKRELRLDAAAGLQRAARIDSLDVLRQQLAAARGAYFDLKLAQERMQVLAETAQLFSGTLAAAQRRLKAGDLAPADVAKVQVDYERSQNDARAARADLGRAQINVAYLLGLDAEALELRAIDPWPALARADAAAVSDAIEARPDVAAARARVEAAERLRDLARAQRTRDITVGAQVERWIPGGGAPSTSVGLGVAVPLFTGYDYSGDIQKAEVDRYAAMDALARTRAVAMNELRRAAEDLNAAADRLERFDASLLAAANQSAQASEFAFTRGAISVLEVLDARRTLRAVRLDALAARNDHAKALAAWRAAQASVQSLEAR
ncbi:MAG TPA: TolC family protein [Burkholderiales bacterium]|nr:TolC family protein [Burkholderiales bacterium]